jgi:hypothetical protein
MKNFKCLGWLALSALLVFSSCNNDDDDDDPQPKPEPKKVEFSVSLDGSDYAIPDSNSIQAMYNIGISTTHNNVENNTLSINFVDENQDVITISANNPYDVSDDNPGVEAKVYTEVGDDCIDASGAEYCERFTFSFSREEDNGTTTIFTSNTKSAYGSMEITEIDTSSNRVSVVFDAMAYTTDESDSISFEGEATYIGYIEI